MNEVPKPQRNNPDRINWQKLDVPKLMGSVQITELADKVKREDVDLRENAVQDPPQ